MPVNNNFNEHDTILLQPQFDKIRIVILAGLNNDELISTEITIRLLRHLCTGLDSSSPEIWRILATSQLLIFPYLDPIGIHKSLSRVKEKQNIVYQSRSTCGSTSEFSDSRSDAVFDNKDFQRILHHFQPHLVILLESNNASYSLVDSLNRSIELPFTTVHIPSDLSRRISNTELFHNLAIGVSSGVEGLTKNLFSCTQTPQNNKMLSSSDERVSKLFISSTPFTSNFLSHSLSSSSHQTDNMDSNNREPFILRLQTGCRYLSNCSYSSGQQLPELWHYTLIGLDRLFSAVRNLSFCGQLLIESGPLTADLITRLIERRQWVAAPSPQILLQPALYFFQHSNQSSDKESSSTWLSMKINSSTGHFCELIPPGTYLMFSSAGPENSTLDNAYEQVAMAISFHLDHFNGKSNIRLERELSEINFNDPDDIYNHMRKRTVESPTSSCGKMFSVGQSRLYTTLELKIENATSLTGASTNSNIISDSEFLFDVVNDSYPVNHSMKHMPNIAIIGNLHGHDRLTPQLLTHFLNFLCDSRSSQSTVNNLLNSATITIIPVPNPDGLHKSWIKQSATSSWKNHENLPFDREYCYHSESAEDTIPLGYTNDDGVDLWEQLISLTGSNSTTSHHWWWESKSSFESTLKSLAPENLALLKWLQSYQADSIISFPTDQYPILTMIQILVNLLMVADRRRRPGDFRFQYEREQKLENKFAKAAALALGLASMNPQLALEETTDFQLQSSLSFPPPLPLMIPPSIGLTLCPGCFSPTPSGVARVWTDYRFPSLLVGLIEHTSLTGLGSFGVIGHVHDLSDQPIPWVRIHIDYIRSELSTGSSDRNGRFSVILPPGMYRFTLRAHGYLDHSEIVNVDIMKSPIHHIFYLKHLGGLSAAYRLYVLGMIASIIVVVSFTLTICLCYHFCYQPRTPYAIVRRSAGKLDTSSLSSSNQIKRGPYSLLVLDDIHNSSSDNKSDDCLESMLKHDDNNEEIEDNDDTQEVDNIVNDQRIIHCDFDFHEMNKMKSLIKTKLFNKRITNRIHNKNRKYKPKLLSTSSFDDDILEEVQLV
ncbi:unnamed protein product [Heterobilharzia americana]|nr:unnamed protein product [Heterobilharzia americana]